MEITRPMMRAARAAEFEYHRLYHLPGERFRPMPEAQLRAVLEAAVGAIGEEDEPAPEPERQVEQAAPARITPTRIVRAMKPRTRR